MRGLAPIRSRCLDWPGGGLARLPKPTASALADMFSEWAVASVGPCSPAWRRTAWDSGPSSWMIAGALRAASPKIRCFAFTPVCRHAVAGMPCLNHTTPAMSCARGEQYTREVKDQLAGPSYSSSRCVHALRAPPERHARWDAARPLDETASQPGASIVLERQHAALQATNWNPGQTQVATRTGHWKRRLKPST